MLSCPGNRQWKPRMADHTNRQGLGLGSPGTCEVRVAAGLHAHLNGAHENLDCVASRNQRWRS